MQAAGVCVGGQLVPTSLAVRMAVRRPFLTNDGIPNEPRTSPVCPSAPKWPVRVQ